MLNLYLITLILSSVVIILIILFICVIRLEASNFMLFDAGIDYDCLRKVLKTGDIILFESRNNGSIIGDLRHFILAKVMGVEYKHSGVVLKYNGELYLIECCKYSHAGYWLASYINKGNHLIEIDKNTSDIKSRPGGVRIIKLDDVIREYRKEYKGLFCVKFIHEEIPNERVLSELTKYNNIKFADMHKILFRGLLDFLFSIGDNNQKLQDNMVCSQFTHRLLADCNVIKKEISSNLFWPHYYYNGTFDDLAIVKYSSPITFNY